MSTMRDNIPAHTHPDVTLEGSTIKLSVEAMDKLKVAVGDKLCIRFREVPILACPSAIGEDNGGNLITKSLTVSCRGKVGETLATFGSQFTSELESEGYLVLTPFTAEMAEQIQSNQPDLTELPLPYGAEEIHFEYFKDNK
jgi:hypothetical protein